MFKKIIKDTNEEKRSYFSNNVKYFTFYKLYFSLFFRKFLHRVDINGGEAEPLEIPAGGSGRMYGLVSLPSYCPSGKLFICFI